MGRAFPTNPAVRRLATGLAAAGLTLLATGCGATPQVAPVPAGVSGSSAPPVAGPAGTPAASGPSIPQDSIEALPAALRTAMTGVSWRPGCPVGLDDLRLVHVSYVDFDGALRPGQLVVHKAIAEATLRVFQRLRAARFPIRGMALVEEYGGSDDTSMAADNTSAFNCRNVPNTQHLSNHAYGRAIDVNTVENPYLPGGRVMPPAGSAFLDRGNVRKGMIVAGDPTVQAFRAEGFSWGGAWKNGTDYQHFEKA
ncbi:M15 family metallopeptidase [Dactylosporangium vinaceum]|uniref:M15 family metallopeptidase n=1 Tax=Dactylosporangium vinaceum TaxID=53362 RepID=A0ABV5MC99_9ACTN|nr:M15 family metallopeptidase [Dactylosporangium vinaceum]UAB92114.1 M15 family metallopeptidase [Dactylosporangium vinaceum]